MANKKPIAVYGAIAANFCVAVAKFIAALATGSSSMLSEAIHSVVDTGNEGLLLLGIHQSKKPPDEAHPFGHGQELYFWSLIVAIVLFGIGGGMSIFEGIRRLGSEEKLQNPIWNYIVLGLAAIFEATSWTIALREFSRERGRRSFWKALVWSKDPSTYTVLAEDTAALIGLALAAIGVWLAHRLGSHYPDAIASMLIGLVLAAVAFFLGYQSRALLLGESADPEVVDRIHQLAQAEPAVEQVRRPLTMHFGPENVLLTMDIEFRPNLGTEQLIAAVDRLEGKIREAFPDIKQIYIEADAIKARR